MELTVIFAHILIFFIDLIPETWGQLFLYAIGIFIFCKIIKKIRNKKINKAS